MAQSQLIHHLRNDALVSGPFVFSSEVDKSGKSIGEDVFWNIGVSEILVDGTEITSEPNGAIIMKSLTAH